MATIGLSKPFYAIYAASGETVSYTNGGVLGKAVELSMELDGGDANILYADNGPAESATTFGGGTLTITTDDLLPEPAAAILGLTLKAVTEQDDVKEIVFGEGQSIPYVGFGVVVKKQQSGTSKWMGLVYPKVQFQNPGISATTQGESIEWQTKELTATILRDDTAEHNWCRYAIFDTETDAVCCPSREVYPHEDFHSDDSGNGIPLLLLHPCASGAGGARQTGKARKVRD